MYTILQFSFVDSHHKLIRWRFITHGSVDGYSRLILYLQCCTNNRASTVYELFLKAAQEYHLPSRVRCDQDLENVAVARHMIEKRGAERRSMLVGNSTHNQRVERMWRDMHKSATILYYRLFYFMEQQELLDPLNEYHLWALHYVFLPRINKTLREFVRSWNHHPMRTTNHKSPSQLFTAGTILLQNSELPGLDFFLEVDENYGVDPDGPIANDDDMIIKLMYHKHLFISQKDTWRSLERQLILVVSQIILELIYMNKPLELYQVLLKHNCFVL